MNTKIVVVLAVVIISTPIGAQEAPARRAAMLPVLTVCEVLSNRLQYDGQLVRIRGEVVGTDEGTWFKGEKCPGIVTTEGHIWDSVIFIAAPGSPLQIHSVDFEYDLAAQQRLDPKFKELRRKLSTRCIFWTYTGLFETRREWSKMIDGEPRGFGHLNGAPAQLIAKSADDVTTSPTCNQVGAKGKR